MIIIRDSILYVIATGISKGLPFLLLPLLTRVLTVDEFGVLGVATVIIGIFSIIIGLNPSLYIVSQFHKLKKNTIASYVYHIVILSIICSAILAFIFFLFPDLLSDYGITQHMFFVILLISFNRVLFNQALSIVQMEKRAHVYLLLNIAFALPLAILIAFSTLLLNQGWQGVLNSELLVGLILAILIILRLKESGYLKVGLDGEVFRKYIRFSLPLVPHVLAFWVMSYIDRLFLAEMADMEVVGLYSTAYMLGLGISLLHESVHRAWQPYFFEYLANSDCEIRSRMVRYTWLYYLASILGAVVYIGLLYILMPILVGKDFLSAFEFIPLIVLGYTVLGMYRVIAGYMYHGDRTVTLATVTTFSAFVNILMNYILIPINGAIGAAQATLIAFLTMFIIIKIIVIKTSDMPWFHMKRCP